MQESLATALRELPDETGGCWSGGEEQLIEELQRRVGSRADTAGSPSSLLDLREHMASASGVFDELDLDLLDYRELSGEPLEYWREDVTYLPGASGWGPEAPMLVCRRSRVPAVEYYWALGRILKHWDPFPLSLLLFAEGDAGFSPAGRWAGTSFELVRVLRAYYPTFDNVSYEIVSLADPPAARGCLPDYANVREYGRLFELLPRDDYSPFNERMLASIPILREVGITVRQVDRSEDQAGGEHPDPSRTEWIIETPRWDNPDIL
jgi:hypothetical protein